MRREPRWFGEAARLLAQGTPISDAAKALGIARESLSRRLNAPGSSLAAEVERRRGATATDAADKGKALIDQAFSVIEKGLTSADERRAYDAAKVILGKLLPSQQVVRVEEKPAEPATAEDVVRELARALTDVAHVIAQGDVSSEAIALLSEAAARVVAALPLVTHAPAALPTTEEPPVSIEVDAEQHCETADAYRRRVLQ
jgi:hypothetical protein